MTKKPNSLQNFTIQKQLSLFLGEFHIPPAFCYEYFQTYKKVEKFYSEYSNTYHVDSTINILLCLLYQVAILSIIHPSKCFLSKSQTLVAFLLSTCIALTIVLNHVMFSSKSVLMDSILQMTWKFCILIFPPKFPSLSLNV